MNLAYQMQVETTDNYCIVKKVFLGIAIAATAI